MIPETLVCLRPDVVAEPLFNGWYVTLPMIAPQTSAMLVKNQHLKILKSYILSPDLHITASADPAMRGGPFANIDKSRIEEVKAHLQRTLSEQKDLIAFAEDIEALDKMLQTEAAGFSLEPLYSRIPDSLKGYVELVYDLNNVPSMRFIEGLLYLSEYFDTQHQSVLLSASASDSRPFVLSTPRLASNDEINIHRPFSNAVYDELFRMREHPRPFGEICDLLGITKEQHDQFASLFEAVPLSDEKSEEVEGAVQVKYFGHACLLFQTRQVSILFDPLVSYETSGAEPRYTFSDLPEFIDYVVITHAHLDHLVLETLLQLRYKTGNIIVPKTSKGALAEPSLKLLLRHLGFQCTIIELDEMEEVPLPDGLIMSIPFLGEHHDLNISGKSAYGLKLCGRKFLIAADSANLEPRLYDHVRRVYGAFDTIFLGMECDGAPLTWFYGHLLTRQMAREMAYSRQGSGSDQSKASRLVASLGAKQVYVYAMGLESWFGHILSLNYTAESKQIVESDRFIALSNDNHIQSERLYAKRLLSF